MKTIELIRDAEEKSVTKILDVQNEAVKAIKEVKQKIQDKIIQAVEKKFNAKIRKKE